MKRTFRALLVHTAIFALAVAGAGCGSDGSDGMAGKTGDSGAEGTKGDPGVKGDTGDTGPAGAKGAKGDTGDTGDKGDKGDKGAKGEKGDTGDTGDTGAMGEPGTSGIIDRTQLTGDAMTYDLLPVGANGATGVVRFAKFKDGSTLVTVAMDLPADDFGIHPSHIHFNSAAKGGAPARTLNSIDGISGLSDTVVTELNDGTPITYDELIAYNGFVNVHTSPTVAAPIAAGDIGGNILPQGHEKIEYPLMAMNSSGITGTVTFEKRLNGFSLATIDLTGALTDDAPGHIHEGAMGGGGDHIFTFKPVSHTTNTSVSDLHDLDDATAFTFEQLLTFDGSVMLHKSENDATMIAGGNIGSNAFDDTNTTPLTVTLAEVGSSGISGSATIHALASGAAIVMANLHGTTADAVYPVGVFDGSDTQVLELSSVVGGSGTSGSSASAPDSATASFSAITGLTGTIRVMASPDDSTVVAQGTIN